MAEYNTSLSKVLDENIQLLQEIADLCRKPTDGGPQNILLIGAVGAGKSSIINTIFKALTGKSYPIAKTGGGGDISVTIDLNLYRNCGITVNDIDESVHQEILSDVVSRLPNILDCAGQEDISTPCLEEVLELLIGGYIPPSTSLEEVDKLQKRHGAGKLKIVFKQPNNAWKVSKIVFVQSCRQNVPKKLIQCLKNIFKLTDRITLQRKYPVDVIALITKFDIVTKDNTFHKQDSKSVPDSSDDNETSEQVSMNVFLQKEKEIAIEFNLQGTLNSSRFRWASYTDSTSVDDPNIDNTALKFVKRMLMPKRLTQHLGQDLLTNKEWFLLHLQSLPHNIFICHGRVSHLIKENLDVSLLQAQLISTAIIVAVFLVIYSLLFAKI